VLSRWLADHPGNTEVPKNVQKSMAKVKGLLRQKSRKRGRPTTVEQGAPVVATSGEPKTFVKIAPKNLEALEEQIDDCMTLAKKTDKEGLAEVIRMLRNARNAVVWKLGQYLGLSEASPKTLRRAHAIHRISALQTEYSLWERGVEAEILPTCRELGIGFVPYSPLGRGFLTGQVKRAEEYGTDDVRRNHPRFQAGNFDRNLQIVELVRRLAARKGCTAAQIALAWLLHQGEDIAPIPGTKRRTYLRDNVAAVGVELTPEDVAELARDVPSGAAGDRYPSQAMAMLDR
jgi:aryl-alcohol dehydrogenase-like predicted oxidoreductase